MPQLLPPHKPERGAIRATVLPERGAIRADIPGEPIRLCVGCREHGLRSELVRLVLPISAMPDAVTQPSGEVPVELIVDVRKSMPGRGAWLHHSKECLQKAVRRQAISRALRGKAIRLSQVEAYLT